MSTPYKEVLAQGVEIWLGDSYEVLPLIGCVDAVVTDPPYGVELGAGDQRRNGHGLGRGRYQSYEDTENNFAKIIVPALSSALSISQRGLIFCPGHRFHYLPPCEAIGGIYIAASSGRHVWGFNCLATVALYGAAPALNLGAKRTAIANMERPDENGHPCAKPLGWMKWAVDLASLAQQTVLDPFMGSGTTGVACVKLGRRFIGIEIEPIYFDIARRRISEALAQPDLFIQTPKPTKADQLAMLL